MSDEGHGSRPSAEGPVAARSEFDVVVLGTGCAGLTAALAAAERGATVGLFEKAPTVGGMTAISAGVIWIPAHDRSSQDLSAEDAHRYLEAQSFGSMDMELIDAYIATGPELLDFIESTTTLRFSVVPGVTDCKPELPGGRPNGRSLISSPLNGVELGEWDDRLTDYHTSHGVGFDVQTGDRYGGRGGANLVRGLLHALLDYGVEPTTNARATELMVKDGTVCGTRLVTPDGQIEVVARRAVVLATGGFEWNPELIATFLRGPISTAAWPPFNEGDGLKMAMAVGAELGNMSEAWWVPVTDVGLAEVGGKPNGWGFLFERSRPGSILVNRAGRRFVNEAADSTSAAGAFHYLDPRDGYVNLPAFLVFDRRYLDRYGGFGVEPGEPNVPDWFNESPTLASLAERIGIDPAGLDHTVAAWNRNVADLHDPEFGRGESAHDGWSGDRYQPSLAARTLGPIDVAPYYAVRSSIGALGTKGGARTDRDGHVRHALGGVIPGLFAVGNTMAGPTGKAYGGLGGTMGPAMVFGYRAGRAAASKPAH